jgi:hypothetical protein
LKTAFYTIVGDSHYAGCRTDEFIASFKKFHPDIDLFVFGQKEIDETFGANPNLNFYNSKASFAKKIYNDYELVVNIDADHLIFDRLEEILVGDYGVAAPANYNSYMNTGIGTYTFANQEFSKNTLVSHEGYIQGGLIASTSKEFWDDYEFACLKWSKLFGNKENDILNIMCHMLPYNFKFLDGHYDYRNEEFLCYYGCASLGREKEMTVSDGKVFLNNKPVKAYHFARAGKNKPHPDELFQREVNDFIYKGILAQ